MHKLINKMISAAENGDIASLELYLSQQVDINAKDDISRTVLLDATSYDQIETVTFLLKRGADPNVADINGITPLMEAASIGNLEMIRLLLLNGADPMMRDNFDDDAETYASEQKHLQASTFLKERKTGNKGMHPIEYKG